MSGQLRSDCFKLKKSEKEVELLILMNQLIAWHYEHCSAYKSLIDAYGGLQVYKALDDIPPVVAALFKHFDLKSIPDSDVYKVLSSSGTTSQSVSKISLDKETASLQSQALVKILQSFLGKQRKPMVFVECQNPPKDRYAFSARVAGAQGLSLFAREKCYILNDDMSLNVDVLKSFCELHRNEPILFFGFTFIVWCHFLNELERLDIKIDLPNATLIHSGGWKKMLANSVGNIEFKRVISERLGIQSVHDFYGMVEQTGSIFMECDQGVLHCSDYGDVLIRNLETWQVCKIGESGVIQVFSSLTKSYPGHSILTEDLGVLLGEDDCLCGRQGKYFKVQGRIPKAEVRGCSDTYVE